MIRHSHTCCALPCERTRPCRLSHARDVEGRHELSLTKAPTSPSPCRWEPTQHGAHRVRQGAARSHVPATGDAQCVPVITGGCGHAGRLGCGLCRPGGRGGAAVRAVPVRCRLPVGGVRRQTGLTCVPETVTQRRAADREAHQQRRLRPGLCGQVPGRGVYTASWPVVWCGRLWGNTAATSRAIPHTPVLHTTARALTLRPSCPPPRPQFVAVKVLRSERVAPRDYVRAHGTTTPCVHVWRSPRRLARPPWTRPRTPRR